MWTVCVLAAWLTLAVKGQTTEPNSEFSPVVSATCKNGYMSIRIHFTQPFNGIAHAREYRTPACSAFGNGSDTLSFDINLMAPNGSSDYCGVHVSNRTDERSLPLSVRVHRTLELAEDKVYVITCGKAGFRNARNETSQVSLKVLNEQGKRVTNAVFGIPYTLRADFTKPDGMHGIRVKKCFAFNTHNVTVKLIDNRGCAVDASVSPVKYDQTNGQAEIMIASMFKFPNSSQVNFQCDVAICKGMDVAGNCPAPDCSSDSSASKALGDDEESFSASTGIFVFDRSDNAFLAGQCSEGGIHPPWLLYLAIALGVMFLIMLLINCFLCTAMTCSCARTEVIEKDPSVSGDYDPYRSWHGSQYGSRYPSSTIHSARSGSDSDHYAIVTSRPGSRHSGVHRARH